MAGVNFPLPPAGRGTGRAREKKDSLTNPHLPDTRHDARLALLAHAGRTFDWPGGDTDTGRPSTDIVTTSVTTFALRDMADFRRFVMTYCYDSAVFEAKKAIKPFIDKAWSG